jgi:thiol-disulfide isomerase/thioredoxin
MVRRRRVLIWTVLAVALTALLVVGLAGKGSDGRGRIAPALPRQALVGSPGRVALGGPTGRPTIVTFWASWCGPCSHEAPALESFATSLTGRGHLVAVDWSDGASGARSFVRRYHWSFPVLRDANGGVGAGYGLTTLPTSFVIDREGRIVETLHGPQTTQSLNLALVQARRA